VLAKRLTGHSLMLIALLPWGSGLQGGGPQGDGLQGSGLPGASCGADGFDLRPVVADGPAPASAALARIAGPPAQSVDQVTDTESTAGLEDRAADAEDPGSWSLRLRLRGSAARPEDLALYTRLLWQPDARAEL
jgi:hypothetical protein